MDKKKLVEDFLRNYNQKTGANIAIEILDTEIKSTEFANLTKFFPDAGLFTPHMGLNPAEIGDVTKLSTQSNQMAMLKCFQLWKSHYPYATYKTLLEIVLVVDSEMMAKNILEHVANELLKEAKLMDLLRIHNQMTGANIAIEMLDTEIKSTEFVVLANLFPDAGLFTPHMGLSAAEMGDVTKLSTQNIRMAMLKCLQLWKNHDPYATYKTLLEIVLEQEKTEIAKNILQHMIDNELFKKIQPVKLQKAMAQQVL